MTVGIIGNSLGVHESRFVRAFQERDVAAIFIPYSEITNLGSGKPTLKFNGPHPDFLFGGPLHQDGWFTESHNLLPFIAVSYAYDILFESRQNSSASANVRAKLDVCKGLIVDCEAVAEAVVNDFQYSGPLLIRAWGLDGNAREGEDSISTHSNLIKPQLFNILSVRNFSEMHGVLSVIEAFASVASLNTNVHLLLAGDGPLKSTAMEKIKSYGLTSRVDFLGVIKESDLIDLIGKTDLYVSATIVDGTSISLLQAMKSGTSIILSDVGGNPEWANRASGVSLFKSGDVLQLANLMLEQSLKIPQRFDRSKVLNAYANWERNADDIISFCKNYGYNK